MPHLPGLPLPVYLLLLCNFDESRSILEKRQPLNLPAPCQCVAFLAAPHGSGWLGQQPQWPAAGMCVSTGCGGGRGGGGLIWRTHPRPNPPPKT